jgi:hypothetical protein
MLVEQSLCLAEGVREVDGDHLSGHDLAYRFSFFHSVVVLL